MKLWGRRERGGGSKGEGKGRDGQRRRAREHILLFLADSGQVLTSISQWRPLERTLTVK